MAEFIDDDMDFPAYLKETDAQAKVKPASLWIGAMKDRLRNKMNERKVLLPWLKTLDNFDFRLGEVTVWGGVNGHGKSFITSQIALSLMGQGERVCIASFEMKPYKTLERMMRMYCGMNPYSPEFQNEKGFESLDQLHEEFGQWTDGRLWLYDQQGTTESRTVLGMTCYCARELGIKHVFIDNLAKCILNEDDYNAQKAFVDKLTAISRDENIHVHLVHHMRKGSKETDPLDKNDFKGSGSIADQADNLFGIWRNKPKELDVEANGMNAKKFDEPDVTLRIFKQRNYDGNSNGEPVILLWRCKESLQYLGSPKDAPMFFANGFPHAHSPF